MKLTNNSKMPFVKFCILNTSERTASAIVSLFGPRGVAFSYLVIIKSMTHTHIEGMTLLAFGV